MTTTVALLILISGSSPIDVEHLKPAEQKLVEPALSTFELSEDIRKSPKARKMASRERVLRRRQALRGGQQNSMSGLISLIQSNVAPDCWEFSGTGFSSGGGANNGPGSGRQNAENLAELIQQTAQPLSWEINGGNGSISIFP